MLWNDEVSLDQMAVDEMVSWRNEGAPRMHRKTGLLARLESHKFQKSLCGIILYDFSPFLNRRRLCKQLLKSQTSSHDIKSRKSSRFLTGDGATPFRQLAVLSNALLPTD